MTSTQRKAFVGLGVAAAVAVGLVVVKSSASSTVTIPLTGLHYAAPVGWPAPVLGQERAFVVIPTDYAQPTTGVFVAVGAHGTGSKSDPGDLQAALDNSIAVAPGQTIWVRGGTYGGTFHSYLNGTSAQPKIVRAYPGERVTLDGGNSNGVAILTVWGSYTWFWGLDVTSSDTQRTTTASGAGPSGSELPRGQGVQTAQGVNIPGIKFINMTVHDTRQGFSTWKDSPDVEVYGALVYFNGWRSLADGSHGHNRYAQNAPGTLFSQIIDSILFYPFDHNHQFYGSNPGVTANGKSIRNLYIAGGLLDGDGDRNLLIGGEGGPASNHVSDGDWSLYANGTSPGTANEFGYDGKGISGLTLTNGKFWSAVNFDGPITTTSISGNTFRSISGFTLNQYGTGNVMLTTDPLVNDVRVLPNQYEPGMGLIEIMNWSNAASQQVDLAPLNLGNRPYKIINAFDPFGPVVLTGGGAPPPTASPVPPTSSPTASFSTATSTKLPSTTTPTSSPTSAPPTGTATQTPTRTWTPTSSKTVTKTKTPAPSFVYVPLTTPVYVKVSVTPGGP